MKPHLTLILLLSLFIGRNASAQDVHGMSDGYVWPNDPLVMEKLTQWQDLKFGMIIHYGLYSELGVVESWLLCSEEADWIGRDSTIRYEDFKRDYWSAIDRFKPDRLDPEPWAKYGKEAGMKYLVFTTKHHDGFAMFDTKQSDFSITQGAFKGHPRSNIAKEVFNAFRNEGYMIGAYFSKPDWHSQYFWWDRYATPDRNANYSIINNPWRWNKFKEFTYNQIEEIVNGDYGSIDILWLDGGWVYPSTKEQTEARGRRWRGSQDVDIPRIAAMVRKYQPGMLVVDRTITGEYENYQTPEQTIPPHQLITPWESCITMGVDWGWTNHQRYKSPREIIHKLAEIVAKGGSLLLGIGPKPDGTLPDEVIVRLQEIGRWMSRHGKAIYETRPVAYYNEGKIWFTGSKDGTKNYAIVCLEEDEMPATVTWKGVLPKKGSAVRYLPTGEKLKWKKNADEVIITLPQSITSAGEAALTFEFAVEQN
jgi:Alpha-L-fucosidase